MKEKSDLTGLYVRDSVDVPVRLSCVEVDRRGGVRLTDRVCERVAVDKSVFEELNRVGKSGVVNEFTCVACGLEIYTRENDGLDRSAVEGSRVVEVVDGYGDGVEWCCCWSCWRELVGCGSGEDWWG